MKIEIIPWKPFTAVKDNKVVRTWLGAVARFSKQTFEKGMKQGPHTGVKYPSLPNRSSAAGEYPANQGGKLLRSFRTRTTLSEARIGTAVYYAKYLREGWTSRAGRRIGRRKMSDDALKEGAVKARGMSKGWAKWRKR